MGGRVGLTVRFSAEDCYRGSCHTNVLPEGLAAAPFYVDLDASKAHVKAWLTMILEHRRKDPEVEAMWGGHDRLAPTGYGLVLVDYVTSTLISAQGYTNLTSVYAFGAVRNAKWRALSKAKLLYDRKVHGLKPAGRDDRMFTWKVKLPFAHVISGDETTITPDTMAWCQDHIGLTAAEVAVWQAWWQGWEEP